MNKFNYETENNIFEVTKENQFLTVLKLTNKKHGIKSEHSFLGKDDLLSCTISVFHSDEDFKKFEKLCNDNL